MILLGRQLQRLALVAIRPTASSHVVARVDAAVDVRKVPLAGKGLLKSTKLKGAEEGVERSDQIGVGRVSKTPLPNNKNLSRGCLHDPHKPFKDSL